MVQSSLMMSPVWTPAFPPPHPSTVSPYSTDAQIVLRALQAKYGHPLKKEEPQFNTAPAPSPYQKTYGEKFTYHGRFTKVKQEPATPGQDKSRIDSLYSRSERSVEDDQQSPSGSTSGQCELLLTQTHTTDYMNLDEEDDKVQVLLQDGRRSSLHLSHLEERQTPTSFHADRKFSHPNFSPPKCVSTPLLCQDNSDINMPFPYGLTCSTGSPPIDLSPPQQVGEDQGSVDSFSFLAPNPVHLKKKLMSKVSRNGGKRKSLYSAPEFMERDGCDVEERVSQPTGFVEGQLGISQLESDEKDLEDIENILDKNVQTPSKKKCAGFKVPVKPKKVESTRQSKITETAMTYQMNCPSHIQPGTIDVTKLTSESLSRLSSEIRDASEIAVALSYQNGATQLREALIEKKRGCKIEDKLSGMNFTSFLDNAGSVYYVPFDTGSSDYLEIGREVVINLMNSEARKICYCAQDCIKAIIVQFRLSHADVVNKLVMMDPKVACWLTDADNPPASFKQVLTKCGMELKESGSIEDDLKQLSSAMQLLYQRLTSEGQWSLFLKLEMRLTPILSLMELRGIKINTETFVKFGELLKKKTAKVEAAAHQCAGHQFLINSHPQLRQLIFEELKLDAKLPAKAKIARTSVSHQKSTSESVLNQLKEVHPLPGLILEYRQFQKLKSTYVDGMLIHVKDDCLHTFWDQTAAATGRLTSTNPNVQAIPKQPVELTGVVDNFIVGRDSETVTIFMRDPFVSQEGCSLLAADFKQIELRLLAHLANDPQLLQAFSESNCKDIFIELTKQWLGKGYDDITTSDREQTKRVVYSVMYGVGKERLADYLKTSPDTAKAIMQSFLVRFPGVKSYTNQSIETCRQKGYTQTIFKRRRLIPNIQHKSPVLRAQAERQAVNFCVQGSAADLCKAALVQVEYALVQRVHLKSRLLIQIHDELLLEVPDEEITEVKDLVKSIMESSEGLCGDLVELKVPLRVSLSCGKTWGHLECL
ncbi:DNA polymerase nu-like [Lineus longissimus]|uniref:DNA polymerase nu-like n=1 Tax=Lineus longissimus TaxID=88925 RepID=UPI00315D0C7C